jgi:general secretion pathway protein J
MMKNERGFTLLELLIVIAIFAVFALMAYGGLDSVLNTRKRVETALDATAEYQKAYMRLRNDFQQVRNRPARDGFGDPQPALRWDGSGGAARVEFTRGGWRNPLYQARPTLERVSYRLEDHKLLRESFRVLDQAQDSKVVSLPLLEDLDDLKWEFLGQTGEWRTDWPDPNAADQAGAPVAVRVTLVSHSMGTLVFWFRLGLDVAKIPTGQTGGTGTGTGDGETPPVKGTPPPPPGTPGPCDPDTDPNCEE